ncbi:protein YgfX [Agitococcus lubricus]|uniref:Toxin CptA n=1 Tax=Agitococcus lubricus TaxID=1077255 RepID=A0A2T5J095_9GAMM|nr:protein YgfX [Agitococcus lubricus]PTQ89735.1 hypothetical protein C8N29_10559 [Agitococcus lubricus]
MSVWALDTTLKPSYWHRAIVVGAFILAAIAIYCAHLPTWCQVIAGGAWVLLVCITGLGFRVSPYQIHAVQADDKDWWIILRQGQRIKVNLHAQTVWRYLIVLHYQEPNLGTHYSVVIFPDSVSANHYRRLQARLRLSALHPLRLFDW